MMTSSLKKTAMAVAVAGTFASAFPQAHANVVNFSWRGAVTVLNPAGTPLLNSPSDYASGYYANGDAYSVSFGGPYFPANMGPGATSSGYYPGAFKTAYGWYGARTPISGTMSLDISTGAGVGTVNPFFFFGDTPGSGPATSVGRFLDPTFQVVDTAGSIVGTMLIEWNDTVNLVSIVMDGSGLFAGLGSMIGGGPTSSLSGVGALPATENLNFGSISIPRFHPLGPTPIATKTLNALGCEAQLLAVQTSAWAINPTGNVANCTLSQDDGIGGSPMVSGAFQGFNVNFDIMSVHFNSYAQTPVPLPPAIWLFGSGLLGLIGLARRKKKAD